MVALVGESERLFPGSAIFAIRLFALFDIARKQRPSTKWQYFQDARLELSEARANLKTIAARLEELTDEA